MPGFLGDGNEFLEGDRAQFRAVPAAERFKSHETAAGKFILRLKLQRNFILIQSSAQAALHQQSLVSVFLHPGRKELIAVASVVFCAVHCGVGALQQRARVPAIEGKAADSHACSDADFISADPKRLVERLEDTLGFSTRDFRTVIPLRTTVNSSPPTLARRSIPVRRVCTRCATCFRSKSPAG